MFENTKPIQIYAWSFSIWPSKWEICFMRMSKNEKKTMFVMGSPCLLSVQQRMSETILKICQCFECLALRCSPISESRLDAFSQRSGSKVQLQWQFWMRNGSQVILPPLCCQILADCPRATSAKLRNWCRVQPCRGFIWFSSRGTMSSSKDQNASSWSDLFSLCAPCSE